MTNVSKAREQIAMMAKSIFDRGLTHGSTGNISMRLDDGTLLVTPTGSSMGFLDPGRISHLSGTGELLSGDNPTKEMPLHAAFYETRAATGAVVHLHACHSVALSLFPDIDPDNVLPPLTAYGIMQLGKVQLLPFFVPGDPAMGNAVRGLAGKRSAVLLANHGPVVAGKDLEAAVYAMEELEATARLALLLRGVAANALNTDQIAQIVTRFDVDWT
ncbi:aldolase [Roseibium denhamense]|uniref:3-oxo-tetronate 4-phosphate decarboxylase n=1 Tax=Roseibium denhamense TaxID=76305 RepID=A0ABY1PJ85_9HYPH|nr:3-oxo-tetronate 4-phosphate decarboxylase [Roseibium denhamense]MTI05841.1 aldolase [Roseibium denhamense]SMP35465.1 Ribulose-5-phosphate 4-epimerase/Fuculose-1-phosphate aldolase [Roseibium denhamense]